MNCYNDHTLYNIDFYKALHFEQYPDGTQRVFSNLTPRKIMDPYNYCVFFGLNYFIKHYLQDKMFIDGRMKDEFLKDYRQRMKNYLGIERNFYHIKELFEYVSKNGKLPLVIKALPELTVVLEKTPVLTMYNTDPKFYWLTNYIETILSATLWKGCMSATIASHFYQVCDTYASLTCDDISHLSYQCHDFSFRGQSTLECAKLSGAAHLHYFSGTDTLPALIFAGKYYPDLKPTISSIPATEHSVMCSYGQENELETYKRLINDIYPHGFVSIVSDTWDFWNVIDNCLPILKEDILKRNGKVVIRPDSGDPFKIICGHPEASTESEKKGLIERLWDIFGGNINSKGYKVLDPHIGAIYGDSITITSAGLILNELKSKGFASSNIVFGIGSYSYNYNTRDTLGMAIKSTAIVDKNGKVIPIQKNPKTDTGTKKSLSGLFALTEGRPVYFNSWHEYEAYNDDLKIVY